MMVNNFPIIPNDTPCMTEPLSCKIENVFYGRRDIYGRTPQTAAVPGMSDGAGAGAAVPPVAAAPAAPVATEAPAAPAASNETVDDLPF